MCGANEDETEGMRYKQHSESVLRIPEWSRKRREYILISGTPFFSLLEIP